MGMRMRSQATAPGLVRRPLGSDATWTREPPKSWPGDGGALGRDLAATIRGEVQFDAGSRALYATDASNYRQVPIGVVHPLDADDVVAAIEVCRAHGAPIFARGGGTSLAGQSCNVAVVLDFSRHLDRILAIDPDERRAVVEPGVVLDHLRRRAERDHGLTFGPDPATHDHCTIGGMIGNNSCGIHSVMAGRTAENVEELEVLTYDGERLRVGPTSDADLERIVRAGGRRGDIHRRLDRLRRTYAHQIRARYPHIPRRVSGYELEALLPENGLQIARSLVGSESTCALVLTATLRLVPHPPARVLLVIGYEDAYAAADHVLDVLAHGPIGLEGIDRRLVEHEKTKRMNVKALHRLPQGHAWLLAEFGDDAPAAAAARARRVMRKLDRAPSIRAMRLFESAQEQEEIWEVRESGLGSTAWVPGEPDTWPGWEDSAVPPERLGTYLRELRHVLDKYGYDGAFYGHFGQGCLHTRLSFGLRTPSGVAHYRSFVDEAADLVLRHGGSLSGEHGDGQSRAELLPRMYGDELVQAFREFKSIWDPRGRMNPGKIVDPYPIAADLRPGRDEDAWEPSTHFRYPADQFRFSRAAQRCVGVGKCRRDGGGTMCPSWMVTHDERHSTRGRAHLLFEMLEGNPIEDGWRSRHVREALDLCLACKGCKSDCPVNVDMATYKAEFFAHYYRGRLRPRPAYAMGLIYWWARLASVAPRIVNATTHAPGLAAAFKWIAGVAQQRRIPSFARETFRDWFARRSAPATHGKRVLLWPDTFNNFFHPDTARAAVEVLEAAGFEVEIPRRILCCGRPLYDYGMLDLAKRQLRQIMATLGEDIDGTLPIVGLEPSCVATFRDELPNLFPHDATAQRLSRQVVLLSELLDRDGGDLAVAGLSRRAVVHGHCHHKSVLGFEAERRVLERLGLDLDVLDSGCCGMAGSFGFEKEKYEVSMACGERVLLPAVRQSSPEALVIADGFSCREQISEATGRSALHLAEILRMALKHPPGRAASG